MSGPVPRRPRAFAVARVPAVGGAGCGAQLLGQARAALVGRGADIPGRTLGGRQPADDRDDRAVIADRLAGFREVPGILWLAGVAAGHIAHLPRPPSLFLLRDSMGPMTAVFVHGVPETPA